MAAPNPIVDALGLAEDAILAALTPLGLAAWSPEPADLNKWLGLPATDPKHVACALIAHHQDDGGASRRHLQSERWEGLVTIRVRSRSRASAREGLAFAVAALKALPQPDGYTLRAAWVKPRDIPVTDPFVTTRAGIWRVSISRTPTP